MRHMFDNYNNNGILEINYVDQQNSILFKSARSIFKRIFDFIFSLIILIFLIPAFFIIAVLIKVDSPGPVFFCQRRNGFDGKNFYIYKFRSMTVTEDGSNIEQAKLNDCRVTRIGKFLRRTSLDEIPQILNILRGDMSFVGPRPHASAHDDMFLKICPEYKIRFMAKPGLTGLAQITGYRGEIRTDADLVGRVNADIKYIKTWTLTLDLIIFFKTIPLILGDKKAY